MEWFSWTVAVILLISSVVSPWLVARENNKHQLSLKKLDFYDFSKRQALDDFIQAAANLHLNDSVGGIDRFNSSLNRLYIYFDDVPDNIAHIQSLRNSPNFFDDLTSIVQELSKQVTKS